MGYHRPTELRDALELLAGGKVTVLAGGTDLYPATDRSTLTGDILDITGIAALSGITRAGGFIRIGAATTWSELIAADLPDAFDALKLSAGEVGSIQIQNSGTIGGNLCNASPAADGVPPLLVLDAEVELVSLRGTRTLPLRSFVIGNRRTELGVGEVLSAVLIPEASALGRSGFLKLGTRKYLVISIAMVAVRLEVQNNQVERAAIAIGSCSEVAQRLAEVEAALIGQSVKDLIIPRSAIESALSPIDDIRADAAYRLKAAAELVQRALFEVAT